MTSSPAEAGSQSPLQSDSEATLTLPHVRRAAPRLSLPYRRSNASMSSLFVSTSAQHSPSASGSTTPHAGTVDGSLFSPPAARLSIGGTPSSIPMQSDEARLLLVRAFAPRVSVLASTDCQELLRHKGINGGLLELLRPFGERVPGRVVIRDSTGASRPWDDFGIRFTGPSDGQDNPRLNPAPNPNELPEYRPARLRTGGHVEQMDDVVARHLAYAQEQSNPGDFNHGDTRQDPSRPSPFYTLYLRRLLSGMPLTPHETFSHPVALVVAISSRNPAPIDELRSLYTSSNTGEHRLPPWVNNEFLRYYVLIHDEDHDDINKSTALYEQMKRHFGLHCHLLRLRSNECLPSDDDSTRLPTCEWLSAGEELGEIMNRENNDVEEDPTPHIFESDAAAVRAFVREMVTQSVVPAMERASATWNDQVASRRRGISGRFMSLSKRFTPFSSRNSSGPIGASNSNFDALQGFYKPDTPEAVLRKLADYAFMLRDFKLAQSTYDMLCADFKNDKAWKYHAGANEMAAISMLLASPTVSSKVRIETLDQMLETAYYSYLTRCAAPYSALRTLVIATELLRLRGGSALDDAARWATRVLEDRLVGPTGHALLLERIASCYSCRQGLGTLKSGSKSRKAAFFNVLAAEAWLGLEKPQQSEQCLVTASQLYQDQGLGDSETSFDHLTTFLESLRRAVADSRPATRDDHVEAEKPEAMVEEIQQVGEQQQRGHGKSLSLVGAPLALDALGATTMNPPSPTTDRRDLQHDGFE